MDDDVPQHATESLNTYRGQEPNSTQSDMIMFGSSGVDKSKQSEKPRSRTFEEIRAENRKLRAQEQPRVSSDDNTSNGNNCRVGYHS